MLVSLVTGIIILKAVVLLLSTLSLSYPLRICILTSLGLSQIGEFSFVLIRSGHSHGLLNGDLYQLAIASTVLTMLLTPLLISLAPKFADYVEKISVVVGFIKSMEPKQKLGANDVIAQEFEASIEIVTLVLSRLHLPRNVIRAESKLLRADGYQMLRSPAPTMGISEKIVKALASGTTDTFLLSPEQYAVGKTLRSLGLRNETGATIIAVVRRDQSIPNPAANLKLEADDVLVLVGSHVEIESAFVFLERPTVKGSETL